MPENRHVWEERLQKRVAHFRDSNTARLIQRLALDVKWRMSPLDITLSYLSLNP